MIPLRDASFYFYRWNELKLIALATALRTRNALQNDVHRKRSCCNANMSTTFRRGIPGKMIDMVRGRLVRMLTAGRDTEDTDIDIY